MKVICNQKENCACHGIEEFCPHGVVHEENGRLKGLCTGELHRQYTKGAGE